MANGALGWINQIEMGVLTAGNEVASAPVSNLRQPVGAEPWITEFGVTTSSAGAYISLDAGSSVSWRGFGLFRTNLTTLATVTYKLGTTAGGSDVLNTGALTGVIAGRNQHVYVHPTVLNARYLTIDINDSSNPDGQILIGLAFAGNMLIPNVNFDYSSNKGRQNRTDVAESAGGQIYNRQFWQRRFWALNWATLEDDEVSDYLEEADTYGRAGSNVLFVPDYEDALMRDSVFGQLTDPSPFSFSSYGGNATFTWRANIVERL